MSGPLDASGLARSLIERLSTVLIGKRDVIELAITALFAEGHLLIEDVPGVGKTVLARSIARALGLDFQRVQCTSDLLPADLVGAEVWDPSTGQIGLREGPVFTNVLLADELNRMPPRTQSALLECMAERAVTIGRERRELEKPFFVIATQNPASTAGTYPLPENQLDRFLMRISIGHPDVDAEREAVRREDGHARIDTIEPIGEPSLLRSIGESVRAVRLEDELLAWIVDFARRTREEPDFESGLSTRGAQAYHRAARALALVRGRDYVVPDDLDVLLPYVCGHRVHCRVPGKNPGPRLEELREADPPTVLR
ncbi:MAG: AAA family ATPase [Planctomycetes bacterium]|nr:AAA family ATPase [Planctomycetota bacterium]MCB9918045.1 AAA family ATPase [Planctomycetota bacterium]